MIVPKSGLLVSVGFIILPAATVGAMMPSTAMPAAFLIMGLLAIVLTDAVLVYGSLDEVCVECPQVVRLFKNREGNIEIRIRNDRTKARPLRVGLALPREILSPYEDLQTVLPGAHESVRLSWACTPIGGGRHFLQYCYLETSSPMNFWAWRTRKPVRTEIRVYPNLFHERKNLAAFFLNRGSFGIHAQRQVGKGREFEKLRDYIPGDIYEDIHWKATAKRRHPVTKIFQIERTQEVYVVIDVSRLSARGSGSSADGKDSEKSFSRLAQKTGSLPSPDQTRIGDDLTETILDRFITAALIMGLAAERQGDRFGMLFFGDKVLNFLRAGAGKAHYGACRDALYTLHPRDVAPDFGDLCSFIGLRLRRRALLIFLTSLDDPVIAESFVHHIDLIRRRHLVLVNMLNPSGAKPLFSNPNVSSVDDLYRNLGAHLLWSDLRELEKVFQKRGVRFSLLDNEKMCMQLVSQYISVKQRQLL